MEAEPANPQAVRDTVGGLDNIHRPHRPGRTIKDDQGRCGSFISFPSSSGCGEAERQLT